MQERPQNFDEADDESEVTLATPRFDDDEARHANPVVPLEEIPAGGYAAKGPTVGDLVAQMTSEGLHFAPATQEDQPSYTVLYQALLAYDYRLAQLAHR